MANPVCTLTTLVTNAAKYKGSVIDPIRQQALLVLANVYQLAAIGGTDYRSTLTTTLLTDAAGPPTSDDEIMAATIAVAFANATSAGATVPTTLDDKLAEIKGLIHVNGGMQTLKRTNLLLNCKLGRAKAYVQ